MTASLRATATFARLNPDVLASRRPQAFNLENFSPRVRMTFAASKRCVRVIRLPRFETWPLRLTSPDSYLRGVSPQYAPVLAERAKRCARRRAPAQQRIMSSGVRGPTGNWHDPHALDLWASI